MGSVRALRWGLILVVCTVTLLAIRRVPVVDTISAHRAFPVSHSLDPQPAPAPQVSIAAPTAIAGPTTIHAPSLTRSAINLHSLRWLPGASARLCAAKPPALHLAATPLLI